MIALNGIWIVQLKPNSIYSFTVKKIQSDTTHSVGGSHKM